MERIFHPYWLWEDYKSGFYDNATLNSFDVIIDSNPAGVTNFDFNFVVFKL